MKTSLKIINFYDNLEKISYKSNIDVLNPYITTNKNGTGLGLSFVYKIVNDHDGRIEFLRVKEGAKIEITFVK